MPRSSIAISFSIAVLIALTTLIDRVDGQCELGWSNPVQVDYPWSKPYLATEFDEDGDGPNPALTLFTGYVVAPGGSASLSASTIVAWDGTYWRPFPASGVSQSAINAMFAFDEDGPGPTLPALWVSGSFNSINGVPAAGIARYDHGAWHGTADSIAPFPFGAIRKFLSGDPDRNGPILPQLAAIGYTDSGPPSAQVTVVAEFSNNSWMPLGESFPLGFITTNAIVGDPDGAGPIPATYVRTGYYAGQIVGEVQRWTGSEWQRMGGVFNRSPGSPVIFDPDRGGPLEAELYVGGSFIMVGENPINGIARWRAGDWQPLDQELEGTPNVSTTLSVGDDDGEGPRHPSLFVSGSFNVPGAPVEIDSHFGRWDGHQWEGMGGISTTPNMFTVNLEVIGQRELRWFVLGGGGLNVRDSTGWRHIFNTPLAWTPKALGALDLDGPGPEGVSIVVVGMNVEVISDNASKSTAAWDGRKWRGLASNYLGGTIRSLGAFDFDGAGPAPPTLLATGRISFNGQNYAVAHLSNDSWLPMENSLLGSSPERGNRFAIFDVDGDGPNSPELFLGGTFLSLGGDSSLRSLVRWTPAGWTPVESSIVGVVTDMLVQDDDRPGPTRPALYVAGPTSVTSVNMNGVARWNGSAWTSLVDVVTGNVDTPSPVNALCSLEEEPGRFTLCAGGSFTTAQGFVRVARWKNGHWMPMGTSLTSAVTTLVARNDGLFNGSDAYCLTSSGIYRWTGQEWIQLIVGLPSVINVVAIDFDQGGPIAPQVVVSGGYSTVGIETAEPQYAPGLATYGPRQPFYFAMAWNRSVAAGDRLSLKVATGGAEPMTFVWTRNGVTLTDGGAVSGATTRELVINPVAFSDSGQYECIATNACGSIPSGPTLVRVCAAHATGDLNADGHIDGLDISPFVAMWTSPSTPQSDCAVDLTHNGVRDPDDLAWFVGRLLSP